MDDRVRSKAKPFHEDLAKRLAEGEAFRKSVAERANNELIFGDGQTSASSFLMSMKGDEKADALFKKLEGMKEGRKKS